MISVIIPVKNGAATIGSAIESAISQADEIIVVDDGSSDNLDYALSPYDIRLLRNKGRHGPGPARNLGLENAKGDFILFLDADDQLGEKQLYALQEVILKADADMAWCPTLMSFYGCSCQMIFTQDWLELFLEGQSLPMHSMLFRRDKCIPFDPKFIFEDREWQSRMLESGMFAVPTSKTCCLYNWSGPKDRYKYFGEDRIKIRMRIWDWFAGKWPSKYAHANLYGCLKETSQFGKLVPEISIQLLANAFSFVPGGLPDRNNRYFSRIVEMAGLLWHGVQEHPLLETTLSRLPKREAIRKPRRQHSDLIQPELYEIVKNLFPHIFNFNHSTHLQP